MMRRRISIRAKLLFYMTVTILIFTVVLLGFNLIFTKDFYINYKKRLILETSGSIEALLSDAPVSQATNNVFELNRLERRIGAAVFVRMPSGELYYPPRPTPGSQPDRNPFLPFDRFESELDGSFFTISNDPNLDFETLRFQKRLDNGTEILIWLPMDEISESIRVFNMIVLVASLIVLVCSVFWSLYISKKVTNPITQINRVAKKISMQDFSETLTITNYDETGELSESINELSSKLSGAITRLNEKNIQLEKDIIYEKSLDKMRRMFVSNVSHELKTPLFLIQGYAEGLKRVGHKEDKRDFYCDVIMSETEKMDKLLKDLLNLAQLESGVFAVKAEAFDLVSLVTDILHKFKPLFERKGIDIKIKFPEALTVNADPLRIEQVITNFLNNAIDHLSGDNVIAVSVTSEENTAKLTVFNSGENIPDDIIDKLWVAFYKADESRAREYGGTGLGLSIAKAIQESHGGGYGAHNKDGGVEFWITLSSCTKPAAMI